VKRTIKIALVTALAAVLLAGAGCIKRVPIDPASMKVTERTESAKLGDARKMALNVKMDVGKLSIESTPTSAQAVRARFAYAPFTLRPEFSSDMADRYLQVDVRSSSDSRLELRPNVVRNEWNLAVAKGVPTDISVELGAGKGTLDLRGIDLTNLAVTQGAGDVTIDLSKQATPVDVQATLGAGNATIKVPAGAQVRVRGSDDGFGGFRAPGFVKDAGALVNSRYGDSKATAIIEIEMQRGVGDVNIVEVD